LKIGEWQRKFESAGINDEKNNSSSFLCIDKSSITNLLGELHQVLVNKADADLFRCQSRAISFENFYIGDGDKNRAFVYLQVFLLAGRTKSQLQDRGCELLKCLERHFKDPLLSHSAQISVHLNEIPVDRSYKSNHYFKTYTK
jgi:5-carboxymethyl-2-hydroxymuconate isomerase